MLKSERKFFKEHIPICVFSLAAIFFSVATNVYIRQFFGDLVDNLSNIIISEIIVSALILLLLSVTFSWLKSLLVTRLCHRIKKSVYQKSYGFLLYDFHGDLSLGQLTSLLSNDLNATISGTNRLFNKLAPDVLCFCFAMIVLFSINPVVGLAALLSATVPTIFISILSKFQKQAKIKYLKQMEGINDVASEALFSLETIKASGIEENFINSYQLTLNNLLKNRKTLGKIETLLTAPSVFCAFLIQIVIIVVSGFLTAMGKISAGELFIIISLLDYVISPVMSLENSLMAMKTLFAAIKRLEVITSENPQRGFHKSAAASTVTTCPNPCIKLDNVSFSYATGRSIIDKLSLTITSGQPTFISGANGAGKSTLIKLICGALSPSQGDIFLCEHNTRDLSKNDLSAYLSVMTQEPVIFNETILENIRLYDETISRPDVEKICRQIGIHDEITALPKGYDTIISEAGGTLSGGQRERISFARTILRDTPIMIFDEPTAAVDDDRMGKIMDIIREMSLKKVVIVITHDARFTPDGQLIKIGGASK